MAASGDVQYAKSDGVDIAYQSFGTGERNIVFVPGFVSHLDLMWDMPPFGALLRQLMTLGRVTVFDKRGTGLSSRSVGFGSLAERMDDIRVVMDAAEIETADFFGISEGGPLAMLFTATFPERVTSLCLYGTYVRGLWAADFPSGGAPEAAEALAIWLAESWGSGISMGPVMQHVPQSQELIRWLARFERSACTPAQAGEILRANINIDVRHLLPTITVPTRVLHMRGDPLISIDQARYMADHIESAELREGNGEFHMTWEVPRMQWLLTEIAEFLGGPPASAPARIATRGAAGGEPPSRALATVLITDIVRSTERATAAGDQAWSRRLDEHDRVSNDAVSSHSGRVVKSTGDGVLAVFDSPSRAVECARELSGSLEALDLPVRAGLHTGEVELRGSDIGGVGVHLASRVNALAGEGEVWVSRTVRDLISGSGIQLEPRGSHTLKGFDEAWELYAVCG